MARKPKIPEHANHERWLVSYADFITLLFAFFVVMFSAGRTDERKKNDIQEAIAKAFNEYRVLPISDPVRRMGAMGIDGPMIVPKTEYEMREAVRRYANPEFLGEDTLMLQRIEAVPFAELSPTSNIEEAYKVLSQWVEKAKLDDILKVERVSKGVKVVILDKFVFIDGRDVLSTSGKALIERFAVVASELQNYFLVEVITDSKPADETGFRDGFELSQGMADAVKTRLMEYGKISGEKVISVGRGDTLKLATPDGQTQTPNRRIEITLLRSEKDVQ